MRETAVSRQLVAQDAAVKGEIGGRLMAVDISSGETITELIQPAPPAWDAMAAAYGRLYLATMDGTLICLEGKGSA